MEFPFRKKNKLNTEMKSTFLKWQSIGRVQGKEAGTGEIKPGVCMIKSQTMKDWI